MANSEKDEGRFDGYDLDALSGRDDPPESRTVASRARLRQQLLKDIEAYLSSGGKIESAEPGVMGERSQNPGDDYNSRPI